MRSMKELEAERNRSTDRTILLEPKDGKKARNTIGMVDPALFQGDNELHAIMEKDSCLWRLKYMRGAIPEELNQRFTTFKILENTVRNYFGKRDVKISKVID